MARRLVGRRHVALVGPAAMNDPAPLYAAARSVLLDALEALQPHLGAIVLVGAQAVYVRTEGLDVPVAPYTTDGDLVLDPQEISEEPDLGAAMEAGGFSLVIDEVGHPQPGQWVTTRSVEGRPVEIPWTSSFPPASAAPNAAPHV